MIWCWQNCAKCEAPFRARSFTNWCFWCWLDRNPTRKTTR